MAKIFQIMDEIEERSDKGMDHLLEKAFKEGCEHGYNKAMREIHSDERVLYRGGYKEGFEEKIQKLKEKYK